jgi:hypothetical protein
MNLTSERRKIEHAETEKHESSSVPPDARIRGSSAGEGTRPSREGKENASY